MAELVVTQDELALRRRARRRLVGAVAIALTVIVVLPMLFDSEPKPLGPEVDIRIPAQDTPFDAAPPLAPAVPNLAPANAVPALPAEPTQISAAPQANNKSVETQKPVAQQTANPGAAKLAAAKVETTKSTQAKPEAEAKQKAEAKPKPEIKADKKAEAKPEAKPVLKADTPFASQGYFLQLGAFGSESNARQLHAKAIAAGFNASLLGANGQFRVRVGPIPQHARALEIQAKLKAKGFKPVLLGP